MPQHLRTGIKRKGVKRQEQLSGRMLVFLQEPASPSIWLRCRTLLLKLNGVIIYLLYPQNIPHSGNGLPAPPRE